MVPFCIDEVNEHSTHTNVNTNACMCLAFCLGYEDKNLCIWFSIFSPLMLFSLPIFEYWFLQICRTLGTNWHFVVHLSTYRWNSKRASVPFVVGKVVYFSCYASSTLNPKIFIGTCGWLYYWWAWSIMASVVLWLLRKDSCHLAFLELLSFRKQICTSIAKELYLFMFLCVLE